MVTITVALSEDEASTVVTALGYYRDGTSMKARTLAAKINALFEEAVDTEIYGSPGGSESRSI